MSHWFEYTRVALRGTEGAVFALSFLDPIKALLAAILSAVGRFFDSLFQAEIHLVDHLNTIVDDFEELKKNLPKQLKRVKEHKFNPKWKTRVISPPAAIKHFVGIMEFVHNDWKERINKIWAPMHALKLIFKTEAINANDPFHAESGLVKSAVKLDEIATMISEIAKAMDEIKKVDEMFDKILNDILLLEGLFLPQGKSAKFVPVRFRFHSRKKFDPLPLEADPKGTTGRLAAALEGEVEKDIKIKFLEDEIDRIRSGG